MGADPSGRDFPPEKGVLDWVSVVIIKGNKPQESHPGKCVHLHVPCNQFSVLHEIHTARPHGDERHRDGDRKRHIPERQVEIRQQRCRGMPHKVVTHRQLLTAVWGPAHVEDVQYLRVFIAQLRQKVEPDASAPSLIVTEPGVGYRWLG